MTLQDDTPLYQVGQRVVYARERLAGTKECPCCGGDVDQYEDVVTEHVVEVIDTIYHRGGSVTHMYYLSGDIYTNGYMLSLPDEGMEQYG